MDFESKIISRQIGDILYASGLTIGTAESCTGGRISEGDHRHSGLFRLL